MKKTFLIAFIYLLLFTISCFFISFTLQKDKAEKIKPYKKFHTQVKEPSDICVNPKNENFFVVSDNGFLHEVDTLGKIIRTADFEGYDCEGVYADENFVYVVEEMVRKIRVFDIATLELKRTVVLPYQGGRNKAYEAITFNNKKGHMIIITEKDPIYLYELDENLNFYNEIHLGNIARDISATTFYDDRLFFLSDEDREIIEVRPDDYSVKKRWKLPIINPEGLVFTKKGELIVLSDDMEKFFFFNPKDLK